jgi:hypothetical protein
MTQPFANLLEALLNEILPILPENTDNSISDKGFDEVLSFFRESEHWLNEVAVTTAPSDTPFDPKLAQRIKIERDDSKAVTEVLRFSHEHAHHYSIEIGRTDEPFSAALFQPVTAGDWKMTLAALASYDESLAESDEDELNDTSNPKACGFCGRVHNG